MGIKDKRIWLVVGVIFFTLLDAGSMIYYSYLRPSIANIENNLIFRVSGFVGLFITQILILTAIIYYIYHVPKNVKLYSVFVMLIMSVHTFGFLANTYSFINPPLSEEKVPMSLIDALINLSIILVFVLLPIWAYTSGTISTYEILKEKRTENENKNTLV